MARKKREWLLSDCADNQEEVQKKGEVKIKTREPDKPEATKERKCKNCKANAYTGLDFKEFFSVVHSTTMFCFEVAHGKKFVIRTMSALCSGPSFHLSYIARHNR